MALFARKRCVCPGQCVPRVLKMVEFRAKPGVHRVAAFAGGGELQTHMVNRRGQEILLVTRVAGRRQARELPRRRSLVALLALHKCVRASQGEAVLVVLDGVDRNLPALDGMAALAIRAKLPPVNVSVTVRAVRTGVLEDQAGVALGARYLLMHASQRIRRMIVIEFRVRTNWFPTCVCMAVLARNRQGTVRIGDFRLSTAYLGMRSRSGLLRRNNRLWRCSCGFLIPQCEKSRCQPQCNCNQPPTTIHGSPYTVNFMHDRRALAKARTSPDHPCGQIRPMAGESLQTQNFHGVTKPLSRKPPRPGPKVL